MQNKRWSRDTKTTYVLMALVVLHILGSLFFLREYTFHENDLSVRSEQLDALIKDIAIAEEQQASLKDMQEEYVGLSAKRDDANETIEEEKIAKRKLKTLKSSVAKAQAELDAREGDLRSVNTQLASFNESVSSKALEEERLNASTEALTLDIKKLEEQLVAKGNEWKKVSPIEEELASLEQERTAVKLEIENAKQEMAELRTKNANERASLNAKSVAEKVAFDLELVRLKASLRSKKSERSELKDELESLNGNLAKVQESITRERTTRKTLVEKLSTANAELEGLNTQLLDTTNKLSAAKLSLKRTKEIESTWRISAAQKDRLERDKQRLNADIQGLESKKKGLAEEISTAEDRLKERSSEKGGN